MRYTLLLLGFITQSAIAEMYYIDIEFADSQKDDLVKYIAKQNNNLKFDFNKFNKIKDKNIAKDATNLLRIKSKDKTILEKIHNKLNKNYKISYMQKLKLSYI